MPHVIIDAEQSASGLRRGVRALKLRKTWKVTNLPKVLKVAVELPTTAHELSVAELQAWLDSNGRTPRE